MSPTPEVKNTTIEISLNSEEKQVLEKAARLKGLTLTRYLLENALTIAKEEISQSESVVVSEVEWDMFLSVLDNS
ncbi:MAG: DUF1778 domain-containing protein [Cyanobacteria bacterium P01_A01_bin.45]